MIGTYESIQLAIKSVSMSAKNYFFAMCVIKGLWKHFEEKKQKIELAILREKILIWSKF